MGYFLASYFFSYINYLFLFWPILKKICTQYYFLSDFSLDLLSKTESYTIVLDQAERNLRMEKVWNIFHF